MFSNGPSRSIRPLPTQLSATPPARHRFFSPVSLCACRAIRSIASSQTSWTERAKSISRCVTSLSGARASPPNRRSNSRLVIVRPAAKLKYFMLSRRLPSSRRSINSSILEELIDLRDDGSLRLNMKYFNFAAGLTMTSLEFERLFGGEARAPESEVTQREMDLARSVQEVCEEAMLRMARHAHKETGEKNLCLAGGVALNCVGNGRILREGPFDNVWIQPAAGDAGGSLGAALSVWYQ